MIDAANGTRVLDDDQRAAVGASQTTLVTAGAGSGKTSVLAERFAHLVSTTRACADRILCLTFTRKAAAEMFDRIAVRLAAEDRTVDQQVDLANISTIDGFCARVIT